MVTNGLVMKKKCCVHENTNIDLDDFGTVVYLIDKINKKLYRLYNDLITSLGMTPQQYHILSFLWQNDCVPLNELAKVHGTAKSTITGIVDTMEKNGLIVRDRRSTDRRIILICLTKKGRGMQDRAVDLNAITNKCCSGITQQEILQLKGLLLKFNQQVTI